jgi:hypothetical protein
MAGRNVVRLWKEGLENGDKLDLASGAAIKLIPFVNNQGSVEIGNGTLDMDLKVFLGGNGSYALFDTSASRLSTSGAIRNDLNGLGTRFSLVKWFGERGKPGLNADIQNAAEATRMVTDPDFEVLGTNASSDDVTYNAEGGVLLTTDGADGDGVFLLPHLDANQSAWTQVTWGTDESVEWEALIETGAAITNSIIWAGLKLTNTDVVATDADQAYFRYENGVGSGAWQCVSSNAGTDTTTASGVTVAVSTKYHLKIAIDSSRIARFYINGVLVETTAALKTGIDLIPYICVEADGAAEAKTLVAYGTTISRECGAQ